MGKIKNLKLDQDFISNLLNNVELSTAVRPGVVHLTLHDINRVESTLICMVCKDSYVQQSQRYVKNDITMFDDMVFENQALQEEYDALVRQSFSLYERMTELKPESVGKSRTTPDDYKWGIPIEDARYILPLSCKTNMTVTMSGNKFKMFALLLYYMAGTGNISESTWHSLLDELNEVDSECGKTVEKMVKQYGRGAKNPVNSFFKNTDVDKSKLFYADVPEGAVYDLALGTLMSSAADPTEAIKKYSTQEKQEKMVLRVAGMGHYSILEQCRFVSHDACSLTCFHQLIRHRHYDIMPIGLMKLLGLKETNYVIPETILESQFKREFEDIIAEWSDFGHRVVKQEPTNYHCMGTLLNCQVIPFNLIANVRADIDVMKQRLCMNAQWEIRQMMLNRKKELMSTELGFIYKKFAVPNCMSIGCQEGNYAHESCKRTGRNKKFMPIDLNNKEVQ
jgi:thymidylate synthase ThyX